MSRDQRHLEERIIAAAGEFLDNNGETPGYLFGGHGTSMPYRENPYADKDGESLMDDAYEQAIIEHFLPISHIFVNLD